ncbi:MAG TPA: hypothetical protein VKZ84_06640, partial [Bacteriovoracaceae bacterium]|nr:hypothetical protein [Bacteriovoracaceae bacterium]
MKQLNTFLVAVYFLFPLNVSAQDEQPSAVVQAATEVATSEGTLEWLARFMTDGGIFMWIIAIVWCIGIAISAERFKQYFT